MSTAAATFSAARTKPVSRLSTATIATIAVVALFIAMRLWRMTDQALDGDEIFSLQLARLSWSGLFAEAVKDAIHPPLLYILLKPWIAIGGESLFWLRMFPVAATTLCLLPVFAICRDLEISPAARNLAIGIVAVHPYALYYSQHLRMYSLLMLFALVSAWRFERYLGDASVRNLVWLGAINAVLGYTQYYGWCVPLLEFLYLVWKRRNPIPFFISTLPALLLFAPWAVAVGKVLHGRGLQQNLGWITRPTYNDFNWFWVDLSGFSEFRDIGGNGTAWMFLLFLLTYRRYTEVRVQWFMLLWIAPAPIAYGLSLWMPQSVWGHRHLLFAIWPFFLLFCDSVWRIHRILGYAVTVAAIVWGYYAALFHATDNRKFPWDVLIVQMLQNDQSIAGPVPVYSIDPYLDYSINFDLDALKTGRVGPLGPRITKRPDLDKLSAKAARFNVIKVENVDQIHAAYFWVAWTDASWHEKLTPPELLEQRGCEGQQEISQSDSYRHVWLAPVFCKQ